MFLGGGAHLCNQKNEFTLQRGGHADYMLLYLETRAGRAAFAGSAAESQRENVHRWGTVSQSTVVRSHCYLLIFVYVKKC